MGTNFQEQFSKLESKLNGLTGSYLHQSRKEAFQSFNRLGYPGRKHEEWKYFNTTPFSGLSPMDIDNTAILNRDKIRKDLLALDGVMRVVLFNGIPDPELSDIQGNEDLEIMSLAEAWHKYPELVEARFNKLARNQDEAFTSLNSSFYTGGLFILAKKGRENKIPIHITQVWSSELAEELIFNRSLIIAEQSSTLTLIEDSLCLGQNKQDLKLNINSFTEIYCDQNASVKQFQLQDPQSLVRYIGTTEVAVERDAHFENTTITLGGELIRNNLHASIIGTNAFADMRGLYLVRDKNVIDNHLLVDHIAPNCESNQLYKGLMMDEGTGIFNGKIFVKQQAQKTNAYQSNNNLLLSDGATINTKPQLEIFADDVKCSHGATSGNLDTESLFYLMARGIPEDRARAMLTLGFVSKVTEDISHDGFREHITQRLHKIL